MPSRAASVQIRIRSGSAAGSALKARFNTSRRSCVVAAREDSDAGTGRRVQVQIGEGCGEPALQPVRRVASHSVNRTSLRPFHFPPSAMLERTQASNHATRASARSLCCSAIASISSTRLNSAASS